VNGQDECAPGALLEQSWERAAVRVIEAKCPGVRAWYGRATGAWWAIVPVGAGRLVEAVSAEELVSAIRSGPGWPWP
jgi:hypothetical protein